MTVSKRQRMVRRLKGAPLSLRPWSTAVSPAIGQERAQIDGRPRVFVKEVQRVPGGEAVDGESADQPEPGCPRKRVEAGIDEGVMEERARRDEDEPEQAQAWNDLRVQLDQPRPFAPIRFGGIDLEIESAAEIHA